MGFQTSSSAAPTARSAENFSRLMHLVYEAAVQPARWSEAVAAVAASMGANKGLLFTPYLGPQDGGLVFPWNISEADLQRWATRYIEHDIWAAALLERGPVPEGSVYVGEDLVPRAVLEQSVFFREFLCGMGIGHLCTGFVFAGTPGLPATALSIFRPFEAPPFSRDDQAWLRLLVPHLSRALGVMHRLDTARLQTASILSALSRLSFGVALLNERREVLHLNEAARAVITRGDGLTVNGQQQLDAQGHTAGAPSLTQWLTTVHALDQHEPTHFSDGFSVSRGKPGQRYALQCSPLPSSAAWIAEGESVRFVVFITDPAAVRLPGSTRLRQLYGFTEGQARVARTLAGGNSYKTTARLLNISEETVRSHVKEIYAKAHVNRLADLVRILLSQGQVAV
ncbi:helix-turn-helix transcriptional regulator [Ramlibacter sp. 2FC]|uniref:helix-turn-helix transcriptional regulator n=1 Tax=Ramlibacter sp. 2FC TaxID=2502188 RepID=UPI0014853CA1|nr:helix-turn-helix transcriptional regulator [Ramlibacter sp. 2FC]